MKEPKEEQWTPPDPSRRDNDGTMVPVWVILACVGAMIALIAIAALTQGLSQ